jgi:hypothetical protein
MSALWQKYFGTSSGLWLKGFASDAALTLITDFDTGNADAVTSSITSPTSLTPTVNIAFRPESHDGANIIGWRLASFAIENAAGKTPTFVLPRDTRGLRNSGFLSSWLPLYTKDFVTFTRATSRTITSNPGGTITWSFDAPFPDNDRYYILTNPIRQQAQAATFAAELLANYPSNVSPTASADAAGVYNTSPAEVDEDGRAIGEHDQFGLRLQWAGPTTDGQRKRKLVMTAGIHAAGEHVSMLAFEAAIRWMLDSVSTDAVAFRRNWDVWIFFNLNPNGIFGGHGRTTFRSPSIDPNRDWVDGNLAEIAATRGAILSDVATADAFLSYHCFIGAEKNINAAGQLGDTESATWVTDYLEPAFGDTNDEGDLTYTNPGVDFIWAKTNLGATVSLAVECPLNGDTSPSTVESIGTTWLGAIQAADADSFFLDVAPIGISETFVLENRDVSGARTGLLLRWWDAWPPSGAPVAVMVTAAIDASGVMRQSLTPGTAGVIGGTADALGDVGTLELIDPDTVDPKASLVFCGPITLKDTS